MTRILCLLLSMILLAGCNTNAPDYSGAFLQKQTPKQTAKAIESIHQLGESPDDNYRTFYQIFVGSFSDSNNDGIGDLQGIISKLDEVRELGCNALWINPCFDSPFLDGGYDVSDYKKEQMSRSACGGYYRFEFNNSILMPHPYQESICW